MAAVALRIRMQIPGCSTASFSNTPPVCSGDRLGCMACLPKGGLPPPPASPGAHRLLQRDRDEASLRPCLEGTATVRRRRSSLGRDGRAASEKHWSLTGQGERAQELWGSDRTGLLHCRAPSCSCSPSAEQRLLQSTDGWDNALGKHDCD